MKPNVDVFWHLGAAQWDTALPRYILDHAANCIHYPALADKKGDVGVIFIPGRHSCDTYAEVNEAAARFRKCVFIIGGDEEGIYHSDRLEHPNMKIWWFMPPFSPKQKLDRTGPNGWPTGAPEMIAAVGPRERDLDFSFMGQMTHIRRIECVAATQWADSDKCYVVATNGFTQGEPREKYYEIMARSKFVLCPAGPCTPDSFRFAEALEAGCVPIVDNRTQHASYARGYWQYVFGETLPFPVVDSWDTLPLVLEWYLPQWELHAKACQAWWTALKRGMVLTMKADLDA